MPIEMGCTGCGQTLRVGDEHAGKRARCPQCGAIVQIPEAGAAAPPPSAMPPPAESPFGSTMPPMPPPPAESPFASAAPLGGVSNPFADRPDEAPNPYQSPTAPPLRAYHTPHRGGMILAFGILGFLCCALFGVVAWVMGTNDLREIRAGRMDPSGQGMTQAGMIMGIISTALMALYAIFVFGAMVVGMMH
jgi:hypothetical protein